MPEFGKEIKTAFFVVLFAFIGLLVYTKLVGPIPFAVNSVQTNKSDYFRVEGVGEEAAIPDTAVISLGITKNASTVEEAQTQTNQVMNKLTSDLKELGVNKNDIKTTNYSVTPNYDFSTNRQTINGYVVSQNIQVQVKPLARANRALDVATAAGANVIGAISFSLDEQARKELQEKARIKAVKNAKEKAESLAKIAGIRLGRIVDVQEYPTYPQPVPFEATTLEAQKGGTPSSELYPGQSTISITVSLGYETR